MKEETEQGKVEEEKEEEEVDSKEAEKGGEEEVKEEEQRAENMDVFIRLLPPCEGSAGPSVVPP